MITPALSLAQGYSLINNYTTTDGLPSNHIYEAVQDDYGFLWLATDNGVSRFDGKYFKNFTVRDGLPNNDVIQIKKTADGTIWANSYRHLPSYFNTKLNRFIVPYASHSTKMHSGNLLTFLNWTNNNLQIKSQDYYFNATKDTITSSSTEDPLPIDFFKSQCYLYFSALNKKTYIISASNKDTLSIGEYTGELSLINSNKYLITLYEGNEIIYVDLEKRILTKTPLANKTYKIRSLNTAAKQTIITYTNGVVELRALEDLSIQNSLSVSSNTQSAITDRLGNIWVCGANNGISQYATKNVHKILLPKIYQNQKIITAAYNNNNLILGTAEGHVFTINKQTVAHHKIGDKVNAVWNHKFTTVGKKLLTTINYELIIDYWNNHSTNKNQNVNTQIKCATALNDSIAYIGSIGGGLLINVNNSVLQKLPTQEVRIFAASKRSENSVYYLKSEGLYKISLYNSNPIKISTLALQQNENANLVASKDSTLMALCTNFDEIIILENEKTCLRIPQELSQLEGITKITYHNNTFIVSSRVGITLIKLNRLQGKLKYTIHRLTKSDGLPSNSVNDFACHGNTILLATDNGAVELPLNSDGSNMPIIPKLTNISINNKLMQIQNAYKLGANERNINLRFSGIDISGHFKHLLYAINDTSEWQILNNDQLNMQLNHGVTKIFLKGINTNGLCTGNTVSYTFIVNKPFFKSIWFWIISSILVTAGLLRYLNRKKFDKQSASFQQQLLLEKQRQQMTADLHDDIGATLSSLQVNSAVAKAVIEKNPEQAKKVIEKIESQSRDISEKIGDIIWSMKPGKDEFMSIGSRIKNFTNDILGSTPIKYEIIIDEEINKKISDINIRKNLVYIAKEAINNIAKYSKAEHVIIQLQIRNKKILMIIKDDGVGFDATNTEGNGIGNMKQRAMECNGVIDLYSTPIYGTTITLSIPHSSLN